MTIHSARMLGYLTWWTVPDLKAPYNALDALAAQVGLPANYVPTPPDARCCWEKATNVGGARGLPLEVPSDLRYQTFLQYQVDPVLRLLTRRVSDKQPVLRRHLVREAVIPRSREHDKQLSLQTVAVLEFDCLTQNARAYEVPDPDRWVNGNIARLLHAIEDRQVELLSYADGQDVREGVRTLLLQLYRTSLRGNGGVYFVPADAPQAADRMRALHHYISGLSPWKVGQLDPKCRVVTLYDDDNAQAFDLKQDIIASAADEFTAQLQKLVDQVEPVLKGHVTGKTAAKIAGSAMGNLLQVKSAIQAYQTSLQENFQMLDDILQMAQDAVLSANEVEA